MFSFLNFNLVWFCVWENEKIIINHIIIWWFSKTYSPQFAPKHQNSLFFSFQLEAMLDWTVHTYGEGLDFHQHTHTQTHSHSPYLYTGSAFRPNCRASSQCPSSMQASSAVSVNFSLNTFSSGTSWATDANRWRHLSSSSCHSGGSIKEQNKIKKNKTDHWKCFTVGESLA